MSRTPIEVGVQATTDVACAQVTKGDVWNGFEWVSPQRYEEQRATTMPDLPPIQPLPGEPLRDAAEREQQMIACGEHMMQRAQPHFDTTAPTDPLPPWDNPQFQVKVYPNPNNFVRELLQYIGEDISRGGLQETPARVAKAWKHWTSGYGKDPASILKVFEDGAEGVSEMVVVRDIPIYSHCEHHLAPIFGTATIAYIPNGKIVGLSKLNRLADMFARRLQVQERMTNQIADALFDNLKPLGCGVVVTARHMCMESRGVCQSSNTTTSALRGNFKDDATVRNEFLSLANKDR